MLKIRKDTACGRSGREFAEGDAIVRLEKCSHWMLETQAKAMALGAVLGGGEEEDEEGPWLAPPRVPFPADLKCPVCGRHVAREICD